MRDEEKTNERPLGELVLLRQRIAELEGSEATNAQSDNAWQERERWLRAVFEKTGAGMVISDMEGNFLEVNPGFCEFIGYDRDELLKKKVIDVTYPEDLGETKLQFDEVAKKVRSSINLEKRYIRKDGSTVWGHITSVSILNSDGKPIYSAAVIQNITERKRAEEVLSLYKLSSEHSRDIILSIRRADGKILEANAAAVKAYGYRRDEILGLTVHDLRTTETRGTANDQMAKADTEGLLFETVHQRKDGSTFPVEVSSQGEIIGGIRVLISVVRDITERRLAEDAVKENEERFRSLFETSKDSILIVEQQTGGIIDVNPSAIQLWGYSKEELLRMKIKDLSTEPERTIGAVQARVKNVPLGFSRKKDGTVFPIEITVSYFTTGGREFHAAYVRDITERKEAEATAKRLAHENVVLAEIGRIISSTFNIEEVYKSFSEKVRELIRFDRITIGLINADGNTISFPYAEGLSIPGREPGDIGPLAGSTVEKMLQTHAGMIFAMESEEEVVSSFPALLSGFLCGIRSVLAVPLISGDRVIGTLVLQSTLPGIYTEQGLKLVESIGNQIAGAIANAKLYGSLKGAEESLRSSEEKFRELYDSAPVGYHEIDMDGRITNVNRTDQEMLGYSREEMIGEYAWKFTLEEEIAHEELLDKLAGLQPPSHSFEYTFRRKNGTTLPALLEERLNRDEQGSIIGMRVTIQDITERKRAEEEKEKLQAQLIQAQKMESVGRLAGGVAHDFNNKLSVILGYVELALSQDDLGKDLRRQLELILEAAQHSADLTRQLLAFARKQTVIPKVLDLNDTVSGMLKMLQRLIGEEIDLIWNPGGNLSKVKIDFSQIDQVLANLVVNARDAISGTGSVIIKTENTALDDAYCAGHPGSIPGKYVLLKVSDNGLGMNQEVLDHIFEPFFTTKEIGKGTGLGLSTVYGIVKQNNGFIEVGSEPGKGTTFNIYLPRFEGETPQGIEKTEETPKGTETILLVEDEKPVLTLTKTILEGLGYTVLAAQNPEQAIHLIETHDRDIHLLITDVVMPKMNGRELAGRIAAIKPGLKCLYISGYSADVITQQGVLDEGVHFIQKPFKRNEIAKRVREVIDGHP